MSFKCPLCMRIFKVEVEDDDDNNDSEKYSSEMDTRSNLSSEYENDKVEVDDDNDIQNMSFDSIRSAISEMSLEDKFPNDAYKDLMLLVTKYKINNKGGNEIIRFFNKHSNLTESPLPKNIEQGRAFMNNMKFSNLEFSKVLITKYEDKDYFLYYQNLIQCIKNILTVPDITQNFVLSYENYEYNRESIYSEQNTGKWWKTTQESLPTGSKLLSIILYSDATTTDTLGKNRKGYKRSGNKKASPFLTLGKSSYRIVQGIRKTKKEKEKFYDLIKQITLRKANAKHDKKLV
ncbi:hypothetical protein GLOIN_2v1785873 [Rhizophagus clarus]|uniref:Uncharacterized protein n=1 Tax=Rhizophagus clarus TaxID=94130 RepID=A0A8H3KSP2_9GLOM|nr:hypothetical protein GLOIN_2v1785873 [Rhizophagus clarus]